MPGPDHHIPAPPPEVPEEFSAAYREAYFRALADARSSASAPPDHLLARVPRSWLDQGGRRWFWPAALAAGALLLIMGSYALGTALSDGRGSAESSSAGRSQLAGSPSNGGSASGEGRSLSSVRVGAVSADCTAAPGVDSAGHRVSYEPENAVDGDVTTAWRCSGSALGQKLVLRLARAVDITQVGLVPGYAKTDPVSGVDRYAENNRITRVRWTLGDGRVVEQDLDPSPRSRSVQFLRVPATVTDRVTLEILAVSRGSRDTTAISEIELRSAVGSR